MKKKTGMDLAGTESGRDCLEGESAVGQETVRSGSQRFQTIRKPIHSDCPEQEKQKLSKKVKGIA